MQPKSILAVVAYASFVALNIAACSSASSATTSAASSATQTSAPSVMDNVPPIYPNAVLGKRPALGDKLPAKSTTAFSTSDDFATVRQWYKDHLTDATEMRNSQTLDTKSEFTGQGAVGYVVLVQRFQGKTWLLITK